MASLHGRIGRIHLELIPAAHAQIDLRVRHRHRPRRKPLPYELRPAPGIEHPLPARPNHALDLQLNPFSLRAFALYLNRRYGHRPLLWSDLPGDSEAHRAVRSRRFGSRPATARPASAFP